MTANELNAWIDHGGGKELWNKLSAQFNVISFQSANTGAVSYTHLTLPTILLV